MKKYLAFILVLALAVSTVAACGSSDDNETEAVGQTVETETSDDSGNPDGPVISNGDDDVIVGMANPVIEVTLEEQDEMTGIALDAPEGAENVAYYVITDKDDSPMAQTVFTYDGVEYCYRAVPTPLFDAYDNTGMYFEWEEEGTALVDYCDCYYGVCEEAAICYWLDIVPGVNYSLSATPSVTFQEIIGMANMVFAPVQGED